MKFLFLMDPLEKVNFDTDTTFTLMLASHKKNHDVYYLPSGGISRKNGKLFFDVQKVIPQSNRENMFILQEDITLSEDDIHAVFIRTDPPFDSSYLMNTWLLDLLPPRIAVLNRPSGIRQVNEKVFTSQFTDITPRTLISRQIDDCMKFLDEEQSVIAKPTDGYGGKSIFHVKKDDSNAKVILETLSNHGKKEIILQQYIPEAKFGDKRILLLNGEILGAVLRLHPEGDHRNNFYAGGKPHKTDITSNDKKIIERIKPHLLKYGLYFVGIDILGDYLIEINVTSPTCVQEINRLHNAHLEERVIAFTEKLIDQSASVARINT